MRFKRFLLVFLIFVSLSGFSDVVMDLLGREVEIPSKVERIVAAGPGALRLIVYLNATDMVVGVEDFERLRPLGRPYILAHPELKELPRIGPGGPGKLPDMEALVVLNPDVLFMTYVDVKTAQDVQGKTGIPVIVLSYGDLGTFDDEELFDSIELLGKILGKEERAREVIEFIKQIQEDLSRRTENIESPTVYVGGIGYRGVHGIESTMAHYPPFVALRARNVVDELGEGHKFIDLEKLLEWNPEYIFIDENALSMVLEDYRKRGEFYELLDAVKEKRVFGILPYNYYTTNIGTALADAYFIGKILYPKRFEDIDPEKKANEIYEFLLGKAVYEEMAKQFGGFGRIDLSSGKILRGE